MTQHRSRRATPTLLPVRLVALIALQVAPARAEEPVPMTVTALTAQVAPSIFRLASFKGEEERGNGTGFVVREDGVLVTNHHVIEHATGDFRAIAADGTKYAVVGVLAEDEEHDIAIIKVAATGLFPMVLAESASLHVGDQVFILGSSHGLDQSLGVGVISAIRDDFPADFAKRMEKAGGKPKRGPLVQHTASSAGGSSGSPLFDARGRVVGVHHSGYKDAPIYFGAHVDLLRKLLATTDLATAPKPLGPDVAQNLAISGAVFGGIGLIAFVASKTAALRRRRRGEARARN